MDHICKNCFKIYSLSIFQKHLDESIEIELQHCSCKRRIQKLLTDDAVLSSQTTCSLDAFKRGSGQKIVGFSLYGDYNSKKRYTYILYKEFLDIFCCPRQNFFLHRPWSYIPKIIILDFLFRFFF